METYQSHETVSVFKTRRAITHVLALRQITSLRPTEIKELIIVATSDELTDFARTSLTKDELASVSDTQLEDCT